MLARLLALSVCVASFVTPFSGSVLAGPTELVLKQNDAGSGGDAPDSFEHALHIEPGAYGGRIHETPYVNVPGDSLDTNDWFSFEAERGDRITTRFETRGNLASLGVLWAVYTPRGEFATWGGEEPEGRSVLADTDGEWRLRVFDGTGAGVASYSFEIRVIPTDTTFVSRVGPGYLAATFDVPENGFVEVSAALDKGTEDGELFVAIVDALHGLIMLSGTSMELVGAPIEFAAGETRVHLAQPREAQVTGSLEGVLRRSDPLPKGRYHVILFTDVSDSYATVESPGSDLVGARRAGGHAVISRSMAEFEHGTAANLFVGGAQLGASQTVEPAHLLFGRFDCPYLIAAGPCGFSRDGASLQAGGALFLGESGGTWTFERSMYVCAMCRGPAIFVADVDVPAWTS